MIAPARNNSRRRTILARFQSHLARRSVGISALLVAGLTFLSTISGFIRELIIGRSFGATGDTDAFLAAFTIVSFVFLIFIGGALQGAFMPTYQRLRASEDLGAARSLLLWTSKLAAAVGILISLALFLWSETIIGGIYRGFDAQLRQSAATSMRLLSPIIAVAMLGNLAQSVLNARNAFLGPAAIPPMTNIIIIAALVSLMPTLGMQALSLGYLVGYLPWLVLFIFVLAYDRNQIGVIVVQDRKAVAGPLLSLGFFAAFDQISSIVQRSILSEFEPGLLSAFAYGSRLAGLPISILISALAVVLFPKLVTAISVKEESGRESMIYMSIFSTLSIIIPVALFMASESNMIVSVLYSKSNMSGDSISNTASVFMQYAISLPAQALIVILYKIYMASGRNGTLIAISVSSGIMQIVLTYLATAKFGWHGVPIATLTYSYVYCGALLSGVLWSDRASSAAYAKGFLIITLSGFLSGLVALVPIPNESLPTAVVRGVLIMATFITCCISLRERSLLELFRR